MKINKKNMQILNEYFNIYESEEDYELEAWTDGGVNMFIVIYKKNEYGTLSQQLEDYINNFDIDEEIEIHRQNELYKNAFKISESLKDFENWLNWIDDIRKEITE